jgi:hypothetical protein
VHPHFTLLDFFSTHWISWATNPAFFGCLTCLRYLGKKAPHQVDSWVDRLNVSTRFLCWPDIRLKSSRNVFDQFSIFEVACARCDSLRYGAGGRFPDLLGVAWNACFLGAAQRLGCSVSGKARAHRRSAVPWVSLCSPRARCKTENVILSPSRPVGVLNTMSWASCI